MSECIIAISDGIVVAVAVMPHHDEDIVEWSLDPTVQEIIKVPGPVAMHYLAKPWPGREEALRTAPHEQQEGNDG